MGTGETDGQDRESAYVFHNAAEQTEGRFTALPRLYDPGTIRHLDWSVSAVFMASALFLIPVNWEKREFAMNWDTAVKAVDWGTLALRSPTRSASAPPPPVRRSGSASSSGAPSCP